MTETASSTADRWLATLAGRNTWQDTEREVTVVPRAMAGAQLVCTAVVTVSVLVVDQFVRPDSEAAPALVRLVLLLSVFALAWGPVRSFAGRLSPSRSVLLNVAWRSLLGVAVSSSVFAMAPEWWALLSWPIGVVLGCDVALTARAIGWSSSALDWWVAFLMSPLHLGIVGGLLGGWLADRGEALPVSVVPVYATVHVIVLVACGTTVACQFLLTRQEADLDAARADTVRDEHRRSAHWLHDDICAQLRLVALKVQRQDVTVAEVSLMLDELDFALRLRQLDELIDSGSVRLAEVLQPFLRNAQSHGVELERVPTYELASTEVDHDTAVSFRRAAAILSSNALNAGARSLSFDVDVTDWHVELVVTDDAGGFDMGAVVVGRGLWSLQQDLGPENLRIESTAVGSRICAIVPRGARRTRGTPLAHR